MKNFKKALFFMLILSGLATLQSCEQQEMVLNPQTETAMISDKVSVENGRLVFPDRPHFDEVLMSISSENMNDVKKWHTDLNFNSMATVYETAMNELEAIETETDYADFKVKYQDKIKFENDDYDVLVGNLSLATLLNPAGEVIVGGMLFKFTDTHLIVVADKDVQKLNKAMTDLKSNAKNHVFVIKWNEKYAKNCGTSISCEHRDGRKKITATYYADFYASPVYNNGVHTGWYVNNTARVDIKSKKKSLFWFNYKVIIDWGIGYDATAPLGGSASGGTGWTSNDRIHSVSAGLPMNGIYSGNVPIGDVNLYRASFTRVGGHAINNTDNLDNCQGTDFYCP